MDHIKEKISDSLKSEHPFVLYASTNSNATGLFQNKSTTFYTEKYKENGFVFAPFDDKKKSLIIPFSEASKFEFEVEKAALNKASFFESDYTDKTINSHITLVNNTIEEIKSSEIKKIVVSRIENIVVNSFNVYDVFAQLVENYPTAYVYAWYHPKSGLWVGATPERLLSIHKNTFKVMALASTQEYKGNLDVAWGKKEKDEHKIVVDYILSNLEMYKPALSDTYTIKAGNLLHLRADISGEVKQKHTLNDLIKSIHPTPATCGLPKQVSKAFILANENYDRTFYTGFLGEISPDSADLYVNLRCMSVNKNSDIVSLYIGGGITEKSDSVKEWEETVAKSLVMKKVL